MQALCWDYNGKQKCSLSSWSLSTIGMEAVIIYFNKYVLFIVCFEEEVHGTIRDLLCSEGQEKIPGETDAYTEIGSIFRS